MKRAGFSLVEVSVALVIAGITALAATSLHSAMVRIFAQERRISQLAARMMATNQFFVREFSSVGGNGATASSAIRIVDGNDPECRATTGDYPICPFGSDRVTVFSAVTNAPLCRISHVRRDADGLTLSFWFRDRNNRPQCCFNDEKNGSRVEGGPKTQYLRRTALMVREELHRAVVLTADANGVGETTAPGPSNYSNFDGDGDGDADPPRDRDGDGDPDTQCTFRVVDILPASERVEPADIDEWVNGTVTIADMRTFFIDPREDPPVLVMHTDLDENGAGAAPTLTNAGTPGGPHNWTDPVAPPESETLIVSEGVYDFQVALGFDTNGNGVVDAGEWVGDSAGEVRNHLDDPRLRLIRFNVVQGVPLTTSMSTQPVRSPMNPGGPTPNYGRPDVFMRSASVDVSPRNADGLTNGGR